MDHPIHHHMTTRQGGISQHPFDSLNLGDHVGDAPAAVAANRHILQQQLGVRPVFLKQVHGTRCIQIDVNTPDGLEADAVVTTDPGVACTIMVADCLPVLFWNASGTVVGGAHAGWRGLVGGVLEATIHELRGLLKAGDPLCAWLGPCIGFEHFEVGTEVAMQFLPQHRQALGGGQYLVDLVGAARWRLTALCVVCLTGNEGLPSWCTVSNPLDYFSHRRDSKLSGSSGRMAACIWIHS